MVHLETYSLGLTKGITVFLFVLFISVWTLNGVIIVSLCLVNFHL